MINIVLIQRKKTAAYEQYNVNPEKYTSHAYSRACYRVAPGKKHASSRQQYKANSEKGLCC